MWLPTLPAKNAGKGGAPSSLFVDQRKTLGQPPIDDSYFFYGKGDGTFGTAIAIADTIKNQGGYGIASGNFITSDKAPDLAIPIQNYGKVAILLNTK